MTGDYFIVDGVGKTPVYGQAKGAAIARARQCDAPVQVTLYRDGVAIKTVAYNGAGECARLWKGEWFHGTN